MSCPSLPGRWSLHLRELQGAPEEEGADHCGSSGSCSEAGWGDPYHSSKEGGKQEQRRAGSPSPAPTRGAGTDGSGREEGPVCSGPM